VLLKKKNMSIAILFPGQGSQSIGMGKDLCENFSIAKEVFQEVDNALSQNLSKLMFEGDGADLNLTSNTQPAIMSVSMALVRVIEKEIGQKIFEFSKDFAGHSLGEFSALCASGSISLSDTAKLLRVRGDAMQSAVPKGEGGMVALIGGELSEVEKIVAHCAQKGVCEIANDNGAGQFVISGSIEAMNFAVDQVKDFTIRKAILLKVSAPFHCSLIKSAAEKLGAKLSDMEVNDCKNNCYSNVTAAPYVDAANIKSDLVKQVTSRVRWRDIMHQLHDEKSISTYIEIGPGKVLSNLAKRELGGVSTTNVSDTTSLDELLKQYC